MRDKFNEKVIFGDYPAWAGYLGWLLIALIITAIIAYTSSVYLAPTLRSAQVANYTRYTVLLPCVISIFLILFLIASRYNTQFEITNYSVRVRKGVIFRFQKCVPVANVVGTELEYWPFQRALRIGNIKFITADLPKHITLRFANLSCPLILKSLIDRTVREVKGEDIDRVDV